MQENTATVLHVGQILHLLNENVMEGASIIIFILFYDIIFFYCFSKLNYLLGMIRVSVFINCLLQPVLENIRLSRDRKLQEIKKFNFLTVFFIVPLFVYTCIKLMDSSYLFF